MAGVFRTGLSTAKQAELLKDLEVVVGGGTVQSDDEIIADLSQKGADRQDGNKQLRDESGNYLIELEKIESKYRFVLIFNYVLSLVILGIAISWVSI